MIELDKRSAGAVFFIPRDSRSEADLLKLANLDVRMTYGTRPPTLSSIWTTSAGINPWTEIGESRGCLAFFLDFAQHRVLVIYFSSRDMFDLFQENQRRAKARGGELPIEEDAVLPLATAFRDACDRLEPDVAFFVHSQDKLQPEYIAEDYEPLVRIGDVTRLTGRGPFGLFYVKAALEDSLILNVFNESNERFPSASGFILLGGRGLDRWYFSDLNRDILAER